jgi:hypothetical protein
MTTAIAPPSNEQESRNAASSRAESGRLTVGAVPPQQADEAAGLTVPAAMPRATTALVEAAADRSDVNLPISSHAPLFQEFMAWRLKNHKGP